MPTEEFVVAKRLTLYRNGDSSFRPMPWVYSSKKYRTWDKVEEELERLVPPRKARWGYAGMGSKVLYTLDGSEKIKSVEAFHASEETAFVIAGPEPFTRINYTKIPPRTPKSKDDPSASDPYYFREKMKNGEKREKGRRIYDRDDPNLKTKKFMVYANGEEKLPPKQYVWRLKQTPTFDGMLADLKRLVPPSNGGDIQNLYSLDGSVSIEEWEEIKEGESYVAAEGDYEKVHNGYENIGKDESGKPIKPFGRQKDLPDEDAPWDDSDAVERDRRALSAHRKKFAGKRRPRDRIYQREDQTNPSSVKIYAFRHGHGEEFKTVTFTEKQLRRGMAWVCERVAAKLAIAPRALCRLDGSPVQQPSELVNLGAYVLMPFGESYSDKAWYFLSADAVDTSEQRGKSRAQRRLEPEDEYEEEEDYGYDEDEYEDRRSTTPERKESRRSERPPSGQSKRSSKTQASRRRTPTSTDEETDYEAEELQSRQLSRQPSRRRGSGGSGDSRTESARDSRGDRYSDYRRQSAQSKRSEASRRSSRAASRKDSGGSRREDSGGSRRESRQPSRKSSLDSRRDSRKESRAASQNYDRLTIDSRDSKRSANSRRSSARSSRSVASRR